MKCYDSPSYLKILLHFAPRCHSIGGGAPAFFFLCTRKRKIGKIHDERNGGGDEEKSSSIACTNACPATWETTRIRACTNAVLIALPA